MPTTNQQRNATAAAASSQTVRFCLGGHGEQRDACLCARREEEDRFLKRTKIFLSRNAWNEKCENKASFSRSCESSCDVVWMNGVQQFEVSNAFHHDGVRWYEIEIYGKSLDGSIVKGMRCEVHVEKFIGNRTDINSPKAWGKLQSRYVTVSRAGSWNAAV